MVRFWQMPLEAFLPPFVCLGWYNLVLSIRSLPVPQQGNLAGPQDISPSGSLSFYLLEILRHNRLLLREHCARLYVPRGCQCLTSEDP